MAGICQLNYAEVTVTNTGTVATETPFSLALQTESSETNITVTGGNTITISNPGTYFLQFNGSFHANGTVYIEMIENPSTVLRTQPIKPPNNVIATSFSQILTVTSPRSIFFQLSSVGSSITGTIDLLIDVIQIG